MQKFLASILIMTSLSLTACGVNEQATNGETPGTKVYETNEFSMEIPQDWETLEQESFTSDVPLGTIVAFKNNIKNEIFTANLNVTKAELKEENTLEDFYKQSLEKAKDSLISFEEINSGKTEIKFGEENLEGYLVTSQGKASASSPVLEFKQIYVANNGTLFIVTAAYLSTEEESVVIMLDEMLNSFSLK